ncbi:MAG: endospore germination permease [Bacillota bacterium]|nr:endospore germination permease [Bacillota bacterium]
MKNKITFGKWEAAGLLINAISARIFLNFPRPLVESSGTAAWIQMLYVSILALIGFTIIIKLYKKFEGRDLMDISDHIGGGILRFITGIILLVTFIVVCSIILREYSENMKVIAFNVSPISFVMLFFLVGMIVAAYLGMEAIVRLHAIAIPIITVGFVIIFLGVAPFYDVSNLYPLLGNGPKKIFGSGFFALSTFSPLVYLYLMPPFIKTHKNLKRAGYIGIAFSIFFSMASVLVYEMVFGYPSGTESFLPTFELARLINYGRFFQRVESVFMFSWVISAMLYLSIILYFSAYVLQKMFRLKFYKPLIFPLVVIIFCISFLPPNLMTSITLETKYFTYFLWTLGFVIPVILLLIGRFVKRKPEKEILKDE